ncbi:MAG: DUF4011 domain-containing protein [Myxococcales bacterium]|nr:DUF4011 domain-containing protein [Myxococcales bacterium]
MPARGAYSPAVTAPAAARRLDRWKLSLLDLTLRNRLLDARDGRQVVPLAGVDAVALAARLDDGAPLELATTPAIDPAAVGGGERAAEAAAKAGADALAQRRLLAALSADELDRRLVAMARSARESLQESGASTLWLALGVLRWFETDGGEIARHAPLALFPVELRRAGARERYQLTARADEEPRWNDTLFEKLATEFGIRVTPPTGERDELDLAGLMGTLGAAVAKLPGWQVLPEARLGVFAFAKFVMWTDLAERGEALLAAPVVRHLATGDGAAFPAQPAFPAAATLDETLPLGELFAPLDCDASQLAAVLAAAAGRSFVLQGPPGTGKSQTITNLIAQALTNGKTVLFVAEKQAALEVVQRRLAAAGPGRLLSRAALAQGRQARGDRRAGPGARAGVAAQRAGHRRRSAAGRGPRRTQPLRRRAARAGGGRRLGPRRAGRAGPAARRAGLARRHRRHRRRHRRAARGRAPVRRGRGRDRAGDRAPVARLDARHLAAVDRGRGARRAGRGRGGRRRAGAGGRRAGAAAARRGRAHPRSARGAGHAGRSPGEDAAPGRRAHRGGAGPSARGRGQRRGRRAHRAGQGPGHRRRRRGGRAHRRRRVAGAGPAPPRTRAHAGRALERAGLRAAAGRPGRAV